MRVSVVSIFAALLCAASAKKCVNQTIPVSIASRNAVFGNIVNPQTNLQATNLSLVLAQQGHNATAEGLTGYRTISKTYHISTRFCTPDYPTEKNPAVQILTHGIGFDKTYWDLSYDNFRQSYINTAVANRYCTLSYDRLGIGKSSHGEPRDEIQAALEIAALRAMTLMLREGKFPKVPHAFSKIIHVGHSFGSGQSYALTAMYPTISDGIVLTGFSTNGSFVPLFDLAANWEQAALNAPKTLGDYPRGYLVASDEEAIEILFLLPGHFDAPLLPLAQATKQPVTTGELLTVGSLPAVNPFKGPVLVFTGCMFFLSRS